MVVVVVILKIFHFFHFFMLKIFKFFKMGFSMFFSLLLCLLNVNLLEQGAQCMASDRIGHDSEFG